MDLSCLGIHPGISEVIATSWNGSKPHAAALGLRYQASRLWIRIYTPSRTLENLRILPQLGINLISDPLKFILELYRSPRFEFFHGFPMLNSAEAWILCNAKLSNQAPGFSEYDLHPLNSLARSPNPRPIRRASWALMELEILGSRKSKIPAQEFASKLDWYLGILRRCGSEMEMELFQALQGKYKLIPAP